MGGRKVKILEVDGRPFLSTKRNVRYRDLCYTEGNGSQDSGAYFGGMDEHATYW